MERPRNDPTTDRNTSSRPWSRREGDLESPGRLLRLRTGDMEQNRDSIVAQGAFVAGIPDVASHLVGDRSDFPYQVKIPGPFTSYSSMKARSAATRRDILVLVPQT